MSQNNIVGSIKNKIRNNLINSPTGKITSAIVGGYYDLKTKLNKKKSDSDVAVLKNARNYDNAPDFDAEGMPTDAFKTRQAAEKIKERLIKNQEKTKTLAKPIDNLNKLKKDSILKKIDKIGEVKPIDNLNKFKKDSILRKKEI